jgi:hypothetical protein
MTKVSAFFSDNAVRCIVVDLEMDGGQYQCLFLRGGGIF